MKRQVVLLTNVTFLLVLIGILAVYSAKTAKSFTIKPLDDAGPAAQSQTHGPWKVVSAQLRIVAIAVACFLGAASFDYHRFRNRAILWPLMGGAAALLVVVLLFGEEIDGARRWLIILGQSIQPSDFAKLLVVIALAVKLAENQKDIRSYSRGFLPPMLIFLFYAGLIVVEPDIGTPVVLGAVVLLMVMMAGARWVHAASSFVPAALFIGAYAVWKGHARERLQSYIQRWAEDATPGDQLRLSLWAFARGGILGQGPGAGHAKLYLPQADSDFVLATWGEEMGLVGTLLVVILFVVFAVVAMRIAICAPDLLGSLLAAGLTTIISLQALANVGVVTGLFPTKGLTLPFISAGGTALIVNLTMVGILINIGSQAVEYDRPRSLASARR